MAIVVTLGKSPLDSTVIDRLASVAYHFSRLEELCREYQTLLRVFESRSAASPIASSSTSSTETTVPGTSFRDQEVHRKVVRKRERALSGSEGLLSYASPGTELLGLPTEHLAQQLEQLEEIISDLKLLLGEPQKDTCLQLDAEQFVNQAGLPPSFLTEMQLWPSILREAVNSNSPGALLLKPGTSVLRPYLAAPALKKLKTANVSQLVSGDPIHIPFSPEEEAVLSSNRITGVSSYDLSRCHLPGRAQIDLKNFFLNQTGDNSRAPLDLSDEFIYYQPKRPARRDNLLSMLKHRQLDLKGFGTSKQQEAALLARFRQYEAISVSTVPSGPVVDVKFHPLGEPLLAVGSTRAPNEALLYNIATGHIFTLEGHNTTVSDTAFSLDGRKLITGSFDCSLKVWNVATGKMEFNLGRSVSSPGHTASVNRLGIHPTESQLVASCAQDSSIFLWDINDGTSLFQLQAPGSTQPGVGAPVDLDFGRSFYSNTLLCCAETTGKWAVGEIQAWDVLTGALSYNITSRSAASTCLRVSHCGSMFAAGSTTRRIMVYETKTGQVLYKLDTLLGQSQETNVVSFSPCGRFIQSSGEDNRTIVYDIRFPTLPVHVLCHDRGTEETWQGISSAEWSTSGFLVTGGEDYLVRVWDVRAGEPLVRTLKGHGGPVSSVAISPDECLLASGGDETQVILYSTPSSGWAVGG